MNGRPFLFAQKTGGKKAQKKINSSGCPVESRPGPRCGIPQGRPANAFLHYALGLRRGLSFLFPQPGASMNLGPWRWSLHPLLFGKGVGVHLGSSPNAAIGISCFELLMECFASAIQYYGETIAHIFCTLLY